MRQIETDGYSSLLNNIRLRLTTNEDIQSLCICLKDNDDPEFSGVLRVYPIIDQVQQRQKLSANTISVPAIHQVAHGELPQDEDISDYIPEDDRDAVDAGDQAY